MIVKKTIKYFNQMVEEVKQVIYLNKYVSV